MLRLLIPKYLKLINRINVNFIFFFLHTKFMSIYKLTYIFITILHMKVLYIRTVHVTYEVIRNMIWKHTCPWMRWTSSSLGEKYYFGPSPHWFLFACAPLENLNQSIIGTDEIATGTNENASHAHMHADQWKTDRHTSSTICPPTFFMGIKCWIFISHHYNYFFKTKLECNTKI